MLSYRTILEYSTNESTFSNQFMTRTTSMPLFRKRKINLSTSRSSKKIKPMQNFELINHIKNRKAHQEKIITPEVALEVLRKYLLPMFEADGRNVKARTRPSIYGVAQSSDRSRTENKLSDIIGKELKQMKEELQILKSKLEITETEKEKIKNEVCNYNEMLITSSCTLEMMKYQSESAKQSILRAELNSTSVNQQIGEYQHLTSVKESEKLLIGELLSKERNRNVTLDNKSNELQHWHALFQMQSDIMGERLKGLYLACENITSSAKGKDKLVNENNKLRQNVIDIFFYDLQCNELCKMTITNSKDYVHNNYSQSIQRISYREEAVNLRQHMKEVLKQKSKQINHANDEKDFLEQKCLGLEKKFNELNEGYKKMRQQMAELNLKRKLNGLDEEKLCKYCNKNYFDKDNFNWSCSLHPGK